MKSSLKRTVVMFLVVSLMFASCVAMVGCQNNAAKTSSAGEASSAAGASSTSETTGTSGVTAVTGDPVKIGVLVKNPATTQNVNFKDYLDEIQNEGSFNVEFTMSEAVADASTEKDIIETWATNGVTGIISCVDELSYEAKGQLLQDLNIYFIRYGAPTPTQLVEYGVDNEYFLGGFGPQNVEVEGAKRLTELLLQGVTGEKSFAVGTGAKEDGTEMFVDRFEGIRQGVEEWAQTPGNTIKGGAIVEAAGFGPPLATAVTNIMATKPDIIISTASSASWLGPIESARSDDANYDPLVAVNDSLTSYDWVKDGTVDILYCANDDKIAMAFAYLYNFCRGYDNLAPTDNDGILVVDFEMDIYTSANIDEAETRATSRLYTMDDIKSVLIDFNPEAQLSDYTELLLKR